MLVLMSRYLRSLFMISVSFFLSSCGGGQQGESHFVSTTSAGIASSSSISSISSSTSSTSSSSIGSHVELISVSGTISYDYIPHNINHIGLNYAAVERRPVRGARVELINSSGLVEAVTQSDFAGVYSFSVLQNTLVKVRVKSQFTNSSAPSWDFKVTDNTSENALYVLDGAVVSTGVKNSRRDLHANSGWDGFNYTGVRAAAPFAILDAIYTGMNRVVAADNRKNLSPLELRWSVKNTVADGDYTMGEIGTSFYDGAAIYILGDADMDIDEYDPHVLLHEWGHYLESEIFRSDSIGGAHFRGDYLDMRVSMSEGFANAFSGMMIDDEYYADASGSSQASGISYNIGNNTGLIKGFFSERSIESIFYNFYISASNKIAHDFSPIFQVMSHPLYTSNEALISIYLFQSQLKYQFPEYFSVFNRLMSEQNIFGVNEYADSESNNGGLASVLPLYKLTHVNAPAVNVCSSPEYGKQNKLGNAQYLNFNIDHPGNFSFDIQKSGGALVKSKPEYILYHRGLVLAYEAHRSMDLVEGNVSLLPGNYVLEVYDLNNRHSSNGEKNMTCFNVNITEN
jgi:hypothetical protein